MTDGIPSVETERLVLRGWHDDDLDAYAALCADPEVMRWLGAHGETMTRAETAQQLARFRAHWDEHGFDRIVSVTRPPNRSSRNVMEKLGMTLERTTTHPAHGFDVLVYELARPAPRGQWAGGLIPSGAQGSSPSSSGTASERSKPESS